MRDVARNPREAGGDCRACGNPGALVPRRSEKVRTQTRREEPVRADGSQREPGYLSAIWNLKLNFP